MARVFKCSKCHQLTSEFDFLLGADLCRDCYDTREEYMEEYEGDIEMNIISTVQVSDTTGDDSKENAG